MVELRFGTGEISDFRTLLVADWPTIPRVGETVCLGLAGDLREGDDVGEWKVKDVFYYVEEDALDHTFVMMEKVPWPVPKGRH